jgi:hypothetical protein
MRLQPGGASGGPEQAALQRFYELSSNYFETGVSGWLSVGDLPARYIGGGRELLQVVASVDVAPGGSPLILDVLLSTDSGGTFQSMLGPAGLVIPEAGTNANLTTFVRTDLPDTGIIKFTIRNVGSGVPGGSLRIGIVTGPF